MDDERLKQGTAVFGKDYFRELLERVRSVDTRYCPTKGKMVIIYNKTVKKE